MIKFEIELSDLHIYAFHGVFPFEREIGNEFVVDLKVTVIYSSALADDNLENTVSYSDIYQVVKEEMARSCNLLETVAYRIGERIKSTWKQVESGFVRITKSKPPIPLFIGKASVGYHF